MNDKSTLSEQLRRNAVALISLAIAITSLGYNTWRNEASEENRNRRLVSIEMLLMLGDLQQLTMEAQFGKKDDRAALRREGWAKMLTIRDLSFVSEREVKASTETLFSVWEEEFLDLGNNDDVARLSIIEALENVRMEIHAVLKDLT